ncbi:DUF5691 domain-containing protein [Paraflavitalea pollutisoli]|uniref:DUF5691 domain-containing protein n=1 Tax=Paraflavitalea pollutisoli TaxID=3034143 RepID=UPI0023EAB801|nr:DUF5691 domain-containing protein [Paraflavitalea sp. H1-2-19X]
MQLWQDFVNNAMLGTDKKTAAVDTLPAPLKEAATLVMQQPIDREEQFLRIASLVFNYRQCGVSALQQAVAPLADVAEAEEKPYCSTRAMQVLKDIMEEDNFPLLSRWLQLCAEKGQLVQPDLLPALLSLGRQYKKLQPLLTNSCGKRGAWLSRLNPEWNFSIDATDEEIWQTGAPEQRKAVLQSVRTATPDLARQWVQATWPQEDANTKTELLGILVDGIGEADMPFLESLATEKSKKVKELAIVLLKRIPASSIVQQYLEVLRNAVVLKKEKALLGLSSKQVLEIQLPANVDENIFKSGIEKLSSTKGVSDEDHILYQLVRSVPPTFWEQQLGMTPSEVLTLLKKDSKGKHLLGEIASATVTFGHRDWAQALVQTVDTVHVDLLPLLPVRDQDDYILKALGKGHADEAIAWCASRSGTWSLELTQAIFRYTARHPYQYNRTFYSQVIEQLPLAITADLPGLQPAEEHFKTMWTNISTHIIKLAGLKNQLHQSF